MTVGKARAGRGGDEKAFIPQALEELEQTKQFHLELQSPSSLPSWPWSGAVIQHGWLRRSPGSLELRSAVRPLWTHFKILANQVSTKPRMSIPVYTLALLLSSLICLLSPFPPHHTPRPIPATTHSLSLHPPLPQTTRINHNRISTKLQPTWWKRTCQEAHTPRSALHDYSLHSTLCFTLDNMIFLLFSPPKMLPAGK